MTLPCRAARQTENRDYKQTIFGPPPTGRTAILLLLSVTVIESLLAAGITSFTVNAPVLLAGVTV